MTAPVPVTDEMVERACASLWWNPELAGGPPYVARSRDYLLEYDRYTEEEKASGGRRERDMEAYKAAEAEAYRLNRAAMRAALEAALAAPHGRGGPVADDDDPYVNDVIGGQT